MAEKKERKTVAAEKGASRAEKGKSSVKSEAEGDLNFLESLASFVKLKMLRRKYEVAAVDSVELTKLEELMSSGGKEDKEEASEQIDSLFRRISEVEKRADDRFGLPTALRGVKGISEETKEVASIFHTKLEDLRQSSTEGKLRKAEVVESLEMLEFLSKELGIELDTGASSENLFENERAELLQLRDRAKVLQYRKEIQAVSSSEKETLDTIWDDVLKREDFKESPDPEKRTFSVRRGPKKKERQSEVDEFINEFRKDINEKGVAKLSQEDLVRRILEAKKHADRALIYGKSLDQAEAAYDLAFGMSLVYQNELADRNVSELMEKLKIDSADKEGVEVNLRNAMEQDIQRLWTNEDEGNVAKELERVAEEIERKVLDGEELIEKSEGEKRFDDEVAEIREEEKKAAADKIRMRAEEYAGSLGGDAEHITSVEEAIKAGDRETLEELIRRGDDNGGIEKELREALKRGTEGYLKKLLAYLHKVGYQEGVQDFRLNALMNDARLKLADQPEEGYQKLYKTFTILEQFSDVFSKISTAEELAGAQKSIGVEPLQQWLGESSNKLKYKVKIENLDVKSIAVWNFSDMLDTEGWSAKLIYTGATHNGEAYDNLLLNQLYGDGEYRLKEGFIEKKKELLGDQWEKMADGDLSKMIKVDDEDVKLGSFIRDARWMASTAHGIWKYTGRFGNVVDSIDLGKARINKNLLSIYKNRAYIQEYGIARPYYYDMLGMDNFIYSFQNFKNLVKVGMTNLFVDSGIVSATNISLEKGNPVIKSIEIEKIVDGKVKKVDFISDFHRRIKRIRTIQGEEFESNYIPLEDVKLLSEPKKYWDDYTHARKEYKKRQVAKGKYLSDKALNSEEYRKQITIFQKRWQKNAYTTDELERINKHPNMDWKLINREYKERLDGAPNTLGDSFESFLQNFSYAKLADFGNVRDTDMENYGGYYVSSSKLTGNQKASFDNGSVQSLVETWSAMHSYLPHDSSGFNRFASIMLGTVVDLRRKRYGSIEIAPENADGSFIGHRLSNGEKLVDENGFWIADLNPDDDPKKRPSTMRLVNQSVLGKDKNAKSLKERDVEFMMQFIVNKGALSRDEGNEFLNKRYGGIFKKLPKKTRDPGANLWRWFKRAVYLDSPWYFIDVAFDEGKKVISEFFKYVFSG